MLTARARARAAQAWRLMICPCARVTYGVRRGRPGEPPLSESTLYASSGAGPPDMLRRAVAQHNPAYPSDVEAPTAHNVATPWGRQIGACRTPSHDIPLHLQPRIQHTTTPAQAQEPDRPGKAKRCAACFKLGIWTAPTETPSHHGCLLRAASGPAQALARRRPMRLPVPPELRPGALVP